MDILIIDDDEIFMHQMEKVLILDEHSVDCVISGEKALSKLEQETYDLILMDLKMPGISGVELIQKIRELGCNSIIIMITGYGTIESAVETTKAGVYDYFLKPFDFTKFRSKMKEVEEEIELRKNISSPKLEGPMEYKNFVTLTNLNEYKSPYLVISDENPEKIIRFHKIPHASSIWLSHNNEDNAIAPTKLHLIKSRIQDFVEMNDGGTIILRGIEKLLEIHKWEEVKRFLIYLQSEILASNYSLLLLIDNKEGFGNNTYEALLYEALSFLANPMFNNIIELLSHPLRKSIITLLKTEKKLNFNRIIKILNVKYSSNLAFHLNKLVGEDILEKSENFYSLSGRGIYIAELIFLLEKLGFSDPHSQVKVFGLTRNILEN